MILKKSLPFCLILLSAISFAHNTMADDCSNLDRNHVWISGYKKLEQAIQDNDDKQAILYGESLLEICPKLPKLNYMMAQLYRKRGDDSKTLYYLQNSTRNTKEFVVEANLLEKMWTERIFAENPESAPENVEKLKSKVQSLQDENAQLKDSNRDLQEALTVTQKDKSSSEIAIEKAAEDNHKLWSIMLWSGVGVAAAGLATTIAGAVIRSQMGSPIDYDPEDHTRARVEGNYAVAWTLIGVGVAATVIGSAVTGFASYQYTRNDLLSFALSPQFLYISGTF